MNEEIKKENETVDTQEYVIIGEENYKTELISTGVDCIRFKLADVPITEAVAKFSAVTELKVSGADLQPYGIYKNLLFKSATVDAEGVVTVELHIAIPEEVRIASLEQTQTEQDAVIAELIGGGVNE